MSAALSKRKRQVLRGSGEVLDIIFLPLLWIHFMLVICLSWLFVGFGNISAILLLDDAPRRTSGTGEKKNHTVQKGEAITGNFTSFGRGSSVKITMEVPG